MRVRIRPVRAAHVVALRIDSNGGRTMVSRAADPMPLTEVHAAVALALAHADSEEARARLGRVMAVLERQIDRAGMASSIN